MNGYIWLNTVDQCPQETWNFLEAPLSAFATFHVLWLAVALWKRIGGAKARLHVLWTRWSDHRIQNSLAIQTAVATSWHLKAFHFVFILKITRSFDLSLPMTLSACLTGGLLRFRPSLNLNNGVVTWRDSRLQFICITRVSCSSLWPETVGFRGFLPYLNQIPQ